MLRFLFVILVLMLAALQSAAHEEESCTINGFTAEVGEIFTPPGFPKCIQYKCESGHLKTLKDGCLHDDQCLDVDKTTVKKCRTFLCSKISKGAGFSTYSVAIVKTLCQDKDENCRQPGETFEKVLGKKTYKKCSCKVIENSVSYSCTG